MKKLVTLLVTFILLLTLSGVPAVSATESTLPEITVENTARRTYTLSAPVADGETNYTFIAANYGSNNVLVGVELEPATITEGIASATVNLSSETYAKEATETKFLLWNMDNINPLAIAESKTYPATDVAYGKAVGSATSGTTNQFVGTKSAKAIVDGDSSTYNGFYDKQVGTQGYMYIDLGMAYPIDRIEVLGYTDSEDYPKRGGNFSVTVGNTKPILAAPFEEGAVAGELVVATPEETVVVDNNFKQTIYMPENSEPQRFVSLEKLYENDYGLLIADVKVYVLDEDMPTPAAYVEVAGGKETGGWCDDGGAYTFTHCPTARLVDGDETAEAGFYYNTRVGYMYIDLGDTYQIDHIEVLAQNGSRPKNCGNYDLIVTNDVPDQVPYDSENPGEELLVEHVAHDGNTIYGDIGYKRFDLPADAREYRYVSLEKFVDDGGTYGLTIREVKVYVKAENMPKYVNIAENKYTGGSVSDSGTVGLYCTDSTGYLDQNIAARAADRLIDGDKTTGAGFMVGSNTQGNMFVDLGAAYKIDHIKVLSYNNSNADRANNYTVVLSNAVQNGVTSPDANKYAFAQVTDATTTADATTAKYRTFKVPNNVKDNAYRFVSIEKFVSGSGLGVSEIEVYVREENAASVVVPKVVEIANGKTVSGKAWKNAETLGTVANPANLVDGDSTTIAGFYLNNGTTGYMTIDLSAKCKIEYIDILAYQASNYMRSCDFDIIAGKDAPDDTAFVAGGSEIKVAHVGVDNLATKAEVGYKRYYMPQGSDAYRYITLEKFTSDSVGLLVADVKVYVTPENVPATNVALGKGAVNYATSTDPHVSGCKDPAVITDGKLLSQNSQQYILGLSHWYCLDLGQEYDIERVMMDCVSSTETADYGSHVGIYLSNEPAVRDQALPANLTTILDPETNTTPWGTSVKTIELDTPVTARYVIVKRTAGGVGGTTFRIGELEVWGK